MTLSLQLAVDAIATVQGEPPAGSSQVSAPVLTSKCFCLSSFRYDDNDDEGGSSCLSSPRVMFSVMFHLAAHALVALVRQALVSVPRQTSVAPSKSHDQVPTPSPELESLFFLLQRKLLFFIHLTASVVTMAMA